MHTLLGLVILFVLVHGFNSVVLRILSEIRSGVEYWRKSRKK